MRHHQVASCGVHRSPAALPAALLRQPSASGWRARRR
jgi:hypothetical protein